MEFRDDGGTPMWRARQGRIIDVEQPGIRSWWRRTPWWVVVLWALAIGFVLPWLVFIGGLLGAYLFDRITGRWP